MKYFSDYIKSFGDKTVDIYIDMDGVIADYDVIGYESLKENKDVYLNKRPVLTSIKIFEEISKLNNVNLYILSVSRNINQVEGKIKWLSKNMSFMKIENINIIPREKYNFRKAYDLKCDFLVNNINKSNVNIMIDDSHQVLDAIFDLNMDIIPLHITSILD